MTVAAVTTGASAVAAGAGSGETRRISVGPRGVQADGGSGSAAISSGGRHVAFVSDATNLVAGDTDGVADVFVRNRDTGAIRLIAPGDDPTISTDGRYVAFTSWASDLVPGDTNDASDVFVHDAKTGAVQRVSGGSAGVEADGSSFDAAISADGRHVVFTSWATNLIPGDTNDFSDIFVRDVRGGVTERVSVGPGGVQADLGGSHPWWSAISKDGRYVAFTSFATNLITGDTNDASDVFVRDRRKGVTTRVSVGAAGSQAEGGMRGYGSLRPAISEDGRYVAFESYSSSGLVADPTMNLGETYVRDVKLGVTRRVGVNSAGEQGDGVGSGTVSISPDGRYVAFVSAAGNLVPGDTNGTGDVFLRDVQRGTTKRVSVGSERQQADDSSASWRVGVSRDGRHVAFASWATNLVQADTNGAGDVFVRTR